MKRTRNRGLPHGFAHHVAEAPHRAEPPLRARGRVQVVAHQDGQEQHEHDDERRADRDLLAAADVEVDLVADEARLRRAREQVRRVVVAEHRQRDDHDAREDRRHRERQRDHAEGLERARAEVARRLEQAPVDSVEEGVERQDHERHVAVDEPEDHGRGAAVEPVARRVEDPDPEEHVVHPAVVLEQVDPGEHAHEVADEERRDQADEQEALPAAAVARDVVRDRVGDEERERRRDRRRRRTCARTPSGTPRRS